MKKSVVIVSVIAAIAVAAAVYVEVKVMPALTVSVPEYQAPGRLIELDQNWNESQRTLFHHTAQGTRLIPYAWFMALEQPCLTLTPCEPFASPHYLERFGFLAGKPDPQLNPDGLPVGFARKMDFHDPAGPNSIPTLGLTCAACHTGELRYGGDAVRIEGGPAMIEIAQFQKALGLALALTQKIPVFSYFRYARFEKKVLGPDATDAQKAELKQNLAAFMEPLVAETTFTNDNGIYANEAGFIRTDALTRIGNQVFAVDMKIDGNFAKANAPVRFPQIWDASWMNWIQYNASISDPMVRNIGEALGVRAAVKLYGPDAGDFDNSVDVKGVWTLETVLAGPAPWKGLSSPKWPSVFPALDRAKVAKGAALYKQHCAACHLPPVEDLIADMESPKPVHWWKNDEGRQFLIVKEIPVAEIGTDPHEAMDFIGRTADTGALNKGRVSASAGLDLVTTAIRDRFYDKAGFSPQLRVEWDGGRDLRDPAVRAPAVYKARPLNGIWAVAPYLHNGSVPSLYDLLSAQSERPKTFWLGSRNFDPVKVGYDPSELKGGYLLDTDDAKHPGNGNKGHEFKDGPAGNGVIGPALSPDDRWAIIEYLKSI
jgi:mono/diheme cytochrome c family protein